MSRNLLSDDRLRQFWKELYIETADMKELEKNIIKAVTIIADPFRIGEMKATVEAPADKVRPGGMHSEVYFFQRQKNVGQGIYKAEYPIMGGGIMSIMVRPWGNEAFTLQEQETLAIICREIFIQCSRSQMQNLLLMVINTDMATGVSNSDALMKYAGKLLAMGQIGNYSVLFFNIHNFKYVNKVFPYVEGDVILKNYAVKVQKMLTEDEILARLGGDNFVALVRNEHLDGMIYALQDVRISHKTKEKEKNFRFGATIGYSTLSDIHVPQEIMARSSIAYQMARQRGVGKVVGYSEEICREMMENQSIISNFHGALENREFIVYYQPKVMISDRQICGAEALVRWHRNGQLLPPAEFVPQLEREGSICSLDYYILEEVCKFQRRRIREGKRLVCISVNFSRRHLEEPDMVEHILKVIDNYGLDHEYIEIELTESQDYQNYEIMTGVVNGLREHGIATSMDDFGTGFSSLNMIKEVDLSVIKIDKSFIPLEKEYPDKERDKMMFCSIVSLIKQLGKKTVAEGVETSRQLEYLKEAGCDIVQGYVFDEPLTESEFEERLKTGYPDRRHLTEKFNA